MTGDDFRWKIEKLRNTWNADSNLSNRVNAALDAIGFDQRFADSEIKLGGKKKYLKDSVWGMIEFGPAEIHLIDSPLLQRLRGIHQLGFSYLVYPSAEHTRFIHSLGMAHVVSSFIASIKRNVAVPISDSTQVKAYKSISELGALSEQELIFAALLHDIGHMPFSHASEGALVQQEDLFTCGGQPLGDFLIAARHAFDKTISLSEALSILIILSPRFTAYYRRLTSLSQNAADASLIRIACLVAGVQATDECPNIQELISAAAVDSDKIDYVARDAAACGIAVGIDVSRIFMGSGLVEARRDAYDPSYVGGSNGIVFVVNSSGADTLEEIVQARSALYQRVYLHPVTRTAEALLSRALQTNAADETGAKVTKFVDALDLWAMDDASLLHDLGSHQNSNVAGLARRLKRRNLPKKACVLAGSVATMQAPLGSIFPRLDPNQASAIRKDLANTFIEKLKRDRIHEIGTAEIEQRIRRAAEELADALKKGGGAEGVLPLEPLDIVVVTPIAAMDNTRPDALVFQAGELVRTPALTNVQGQHDAQDIFKAVGYVFCDPDWRVLVLIAARRVVLELSEATEPDGVQHSIQVAEAKEQQLSARRRTILDLEGVARRANIPRNSVERVMRLAGEVGYFDDIPALYIPKNPDESAIHDASAAFRTFSGELGWAVDKSTVAAFVAQFPPRLRDSMLAMLLNGQLLDQAVLSGKLRLAIDRARQGKEEVVLAPLSLSSGGEAMAIVSSMNLEGVRCCAGLREALDVSGNPLMLLIDDNASSGVQAAAQLYAYAGVDRADWPSDLVKEDGLFEKVLGPKEIEKLKDRRFGIVVAVGLESADQRTRAAAEALKFLHFEGLKFGSEIAKGLEWSSELREYLEGIGRELIAHRHAHSSYDEIADPEIKKRCDEHAFGYGGRGGLMVTHGNVPSSTVTALWQPGIVRGRPWIPLFIRRGRLDELVLG